MHCPCRLKTNIDFTNPVVDVTKHTHAGDVNGVKVLKARLTFAYEATRKPRKASSGVCTRSKWLGRTRSRKYEECGIVVNEQSGTLVPVFFRRTQST